MRILASDYDGTFRINEKVSDFDKQMVSLWRKQGNLFGMVTGRSVESIQKEQNVNQFECDFFICNNGGVVYDREMNLLKMELIDFGVANVILDYVRTLPIVSYVINNGYHRSKTVLNEKLVDYKYGSLNEFMKEDELLKGGKIAQIVLSVEDESLSHEICNYINQTFSDNVVSYVNVNCVDIVPVGVSKENGLAYLQKHYGWEQIYTIGDSYNDIGMLEKYDGFTVEHAPDDIKNYAKKVFSSVGKCISELMK